MATQQEDQPAEGYGAAAGSLNDPACKRGTKEFKAAKEENGRLLGLYRSFKEGHEETGASKPDMIAARNVKEAEGDKSGIYGHIPGVAVSDVFEGRGELAVLGLHTQMMKGINNRKDYLSGAMAICMSGGYRDNEDMGERFVYTGAGGQDKGNKQVKDQTYDHADNAALLNNFKTGTPVRVFRAGPGTPPPYTYEGLYKVIAHRMEDSSDGPKVIRFTLQGVPGHFAVSRKVEFRALQRAKAFQKIQLAGAGAEAKQKRRKVDKNYRFNFTIPTKAAIRQSIKERAASGVRGVLVCEDISAGIEKVPIPVWNSLDDQRSLFVPTQLGHLPVDDEENLEFEYLAEYVFTTADTAGKLAEQADKLFKQQCGITCGIQYHGGECPYTDDKRLDWTQTFGLMECPKNCKGGVKGKASLCRRNRVVAEGIKYPLEVFKVAGKGWGARCAVDLQAGRMLCRYIGVVITDAAAEEQAGADTYLYDLDHFHLREEAAAGEEEEDPDRNPRLPPIPDVLKNHHLTVDASHEGNVARFFNHSCDPNCVIQTVFTMNARSQLLHYIVIVAAEDIPAFTELTYDYGSAYIVEGDPQQTAAAEAAVAAAGGAAANARRIPCSCGAQNCRGWLKNC